ncbi:MAG TPA: transcriptional regulator [Spirochaetaceae bacterium]|nr:transcriptional regulator [Spirochaetaceae bacterium]
MRHKAAERARVFKAMGHPSRMLILEALASEAKNVGELTELVGSDISTVSKHLTVLKNAGVVVDESRGRSVYYSLYCTCIPQFMRCVDELIEYKSSRMGCASAQLSTLEA